MYLIENERRLAEAAFFVFRVGVLRFIKQLYVGPSHLRIGSLG